MTIQYVAPALILAFAVGYATGYVVATGKAVRKMHRRQGALGFWSDPSDPDAPQDLKG